MELYLDNKKMPAPKIEGVTFGDEKIWSKNTGRAASGSMTGDIAAIKKTVSVEFPPLSPSEVRLLNSVVSNKAKPFFSFRLNDGGETIELTVYAGTPSRKLYSVVNGMNYYTGYRIELVER